FLGQARIRLNGDLVLLAGTFIFGRHVENTVGVDVERNLDLRDTTGCGRNTFEVELAKQLIAGCNLALALEYLDRYGGLIIFSCREHLREPRRDRGVLRDHFG